MDATDATHSEFHSLAAGWARQVGCKSLATAHYTPGGPDRRGTSWGATRGDRDRTLGMGVYKSNLSNLNSAVSAVITVTKNHSSSEQ
jgi:hypothetical protein